ncbi:STT3 domain-containing protein [Candidatus Omnitrophota bacterium]
MKKNVLITCGLILLVSFFVVFLRVHLLSLPAINHYAESEVYDDVFDKIKEEINEKYKALPLSKRNKLITRSYKDYLKHNKYLLNEQIKQKADERKAYYQNENNYPYIPGIDSYYWLRLIDNLINKGHIGDRVVDGQDYDDLVDMPIEKSLSQSGHLILGSSIYKIFNFLKLDIDYNFGLYLIPLLLSILLVVFTFFVTKLLSRSNTAAFFAAITVNLCPLLLNRTMGEWLDTDIYNVLFPLVIFGAFIFVFKSKDNIKKIIGLAGFALACSIYASIWQGWWHIFDLLILCGMVFIVNEYSSEGKDLALLKKNALWLFLLFLAGILFVGIINGKESLFSFIGEPYKLIFALKDVPRDNWPNVFLTVAELKKVTPYRIALELGGVFIFFVTIIGSVYLVLNKKIIRDRELGIGFFCLFIWLGALYYTSLNAVRFALLLIVPLGIMFGVVFDKLLRSIFKFSLKFPKKIHFSILGLLVLGIYFFMSSYSVRSINIVASKLPLFNDAWNNSFTYIRENSDEDAIINSWWDFGHWFKAVAKRKVLFDGKTQNSPIAFWMARALTTDNENESIGILRMLDISKNEAFELLETCGLTHTEAVGALLDIVKLSEQDARAYLKGLVDEERIDEVVALLFSNEMPQAYYIISYDMVSKMSPISHIGNWDFKKGDIWINASKKRLDEFMAYAEKEHNCTKEEAMSLLGEMSMLSDRDAPGWISSRDTIDAKTLSDKFRKDEDLLIFDNNLILNLSNYSAYVLRGQGQDIGVPFSVAYMEDGALKENILEDSDLDYSVLIFKTDEDAYKSIFLDKDLTKSMFVRMYFLKGEGLTFFEKALEEKTLSDNFVYVYNVNWPQ